MQKHDKRKQKKTKHHDTRSRDVLKILSLTTQIATAGSRLTQSAPYTTIAISYQY
jgi:hypothetical protein